MRAIGIDIGGTTMRVGVVSPGAQVLSIACFPTGTRFDALQDQIADGVGRVLGQVGASRKPSPPVGLAIPGVMNAAGGRFRRAVHLPFLEERDPRDLLPAALRPGALVVSDADAATWGEWLACDRRPSRFAHLRLGTGVACGVVVDGSLVTLSRQSGRHADVLVFDEGPDARLCACGRRGCLETVASREALGRLAGEACAATSLLDLLPAAETGDSRVMELFGRVASAIATVVGHLERAYGVGLVALEGGVVAEVGGLLEAVQASVGSRAGVRVERGRLGDGAGVVGAGVLAMRGVRSIGSIPWKSPAPAE